MRFRFLVVLFAAVIMGYQLLCDPIVGLANNGDFDRILGLFNLRPVCETDDCFFKYVVTRYSFQPVAFEFEQPSSAHVTMLPALLLNWLLSKDGYYDIRFTGLVYGALWIFGLWLLMPLLDHLTRWRRTLMAGLLVMAFTDIIYVQFSNSFYLDTAAVIYCFLMFVFVARLASKTGSPGFNRAGLAVTFVMAWTAKTQHTLLFLPVIAFLVMYRDRYWRGTAKSFYALVTACLIGIAVLVVTAPREHKLISYYNMVFSGILPTAPDRKEALAELGLPSWYAQLSGSHAYSGNTGIHTYRNDLLPHVSQFRILLYYARHPGTAFTLLGNGLSDAGKQRIYGFGNFSKESGYPERTKSRAFALWSNLKEWLLAENPGAVVAYFFLGGAGLWFGTLRRWPDRRDLQSAALVLWTMAGMAFAISTTADVLDTTRHLYVYTFLTDLMIVAAIGVWLYSPKRTA